MLEHSLYITHKNRNYWLLGIADNSLWLAKLLLGGFWNDGEIPYYATTLQLTPIRKFSILWELGNYAEYEASLIDEI